MKERNLKMSEVIIRFLSQEDVVSLGGADYEKAVEDVEQGLIMHTQKKMTSKKISIVIDEKLDWKANSLVSLSERFGANKWLMSNEENRDIGLPRAFSLLILNDRKTGLPKCIMDGTLISALRTGAYSAVAVKYLAKMQAEVIGILGSGVIAKTSLLCLKSFIGKKIRMKRLFSIKEVKVYSDIEEHRNFFIQRMRKDTGLNIRAVNSAEELVKDTDILISATTAFEPIIKEKWVREGCLYVHFGGWEDEYGFPLKCDKIICDDWNHVKERNAQTISYMYKENLLSDKDIYGDIGEIILGKKPGRETEQERIYFNPVGLGELDQIIAERVYIKAEERNVGKELVLWKKFL
jgi:ornithine cyclodeaminase